MLTHRLVTDVESSGEGRVGELGCILNIEKVTVEPCGGRRKDVRNAISLPILL